MSLVENRLLLFVEANVLVYIHMQVLKNNDDVLSKVKTVFELHNAIMAFVVSALVVVNTV